MVAGRKERINERIEELKLQVDNKTKAKLELDKYVRMVEKMDTFSVDCEECDRYLNDLEPFVEELSNKGNSFSKEDYNDNQKKVQELTSHLQKTHDLIPENYYLSVFMPLGIGVGLPFGLLLFDNIALGLPIGMLFGIAIGAGMDADAKKKGKTI